MEYPRLIETGARNYMQTALHTCHENRVKIYSYALNTGVLVLFVATTAAFLYYCYHRKPSEYERQQKLLRDQEYILSKIRFFQTDLKRKAEISSNITNLPNLDTRPIW